MTKGNWKMHLLLLQEIVKACEERDREGDRPTIAAPTPALLEEAVLELARQLRLEARKLRMALDGDAPLAGPDIAAALSTPSGFAEGIEAAAKVCDDKASAAMGVLATAKAADYRNCAYAIRSLSPSPGERASIVAFLRKQAEECHADAGAAVQEGFSAKLAGKVIAAGNALTDAADAIARCDDQRTDHTAGEHDV